MAIQSLETEKYEEDDCLQSLNLVYGERDFSDAAKNGTISSSN